MKSELVEKAKKLGRIGQEVRKEGCMKLDFGGTLYQLDFGYGFIKLTDCEVIIRKVEKGWEKEGFISSTTPRVIVHTEKDGNSDIVKNVTVEYSQWVFPTRFFLKNGDRVNIQCQWYKVLDHDHFNVVPL